VTPAVDWLVEHSLTLDEITSASDQYPNLFTRIAGQIADSVDTIQQHQAMLQQSLDNVRALSKSATKKSAPVKTASSQRSGAFHLKHEE
jgi:hypothetical protein